MNVCVYIDCTEYNDETVINVYSRIEKCKNSEF